MSANVTAIGPGLRQAGGDQRLAPPSVAIHDAAAIRGCLAHALRIGIERDERNLLLFKQPGEILAAAPEAADDHVFLPRHRPRRNLRHLRRTGEPVIGRESAREAARRTWINSGAASIDSTMAATHQLRELRLNDRKIDRERKHDDGELARLGQIEAGAQRHAKRGAEDAGENDHEHELRQHRDDEQEQDPAEVRPHLP